MKRGVFRMKKPYIILAVILIMLGLGGIGVFLKEIVNSRLENLQIVWSQFYSDDSGKVVSGKILNYDPNKKERIVLGDVPLDNMSFAGDSSFIGFQKTFGDANKFLGIVIYHSDTGETEEIADLHSIDNNLSFGKDGNFLLYTDYKYSIVPGNMKIRIKLYDLEEKTTLTAYKGDYSDNIRTVLLR